MSLGYSPSDIIAVGVAAWKLIDKCKNAGDDYKELSELCHEISIIIQQCTPDKPDSVLKLQGQSVDLCSSLCRSTLDDLEALLDKYKDMGTISVRRIRFATSTKSQQESIKRRLSRQIDVINVWINRQTMSYTGQMAVHLMAVLEARNQESGEQLNVQALVADPEKFRKFVAQEFKAGRDDKIKQDIMQNETKISEKLLQMPQTGTFDMVAIKSDSREDTVTSVDADSLDPGPAPEKTDVYQPRNIPWFKHIGQRYLWPVGLTFANSHKILVHTPEISYSKEDAYLCGLPEGWTLIPALGKRRGKNAEGYYLSFNNISCRKDNRPKSTRLYMVDSPLARPASASKDSNEAAAESSPGRFKMDNRSDLPMVLEQPASMARLEIYHPPQYRLDHPTPPWFRGAVQSDRILRDCLGFVDSKLWPFDLSDEVSLEYAQRLYGQDGLPVQYTDDEVSAGLPDHWHYERDKNGVGRHVYIYLGSNPPMKTTVHPARFYRDGDDETQIELPPGWERRVDLFGNLFYVDHNTMSATRDNPKYNPSIEQETGLPLGWRRIEDDRGRPFFYCRKGVHIVGTYTASLLNSKSMKSKHLLSQVPENGDHPSDLILGRTPKDGRAGSEATSVEKIAEMTSEDRSRYWEIFKGIIRQVPYKLTWEEADRHCSTLGLDSAVYQDILREEDKNGDKVFMPQEYARVLHRMRYALQKQFDDSGTPRPTEVQVKGYEGIFSYYISQQPGAVEMTLDHAMQLSQNYYLPKDVVREIWLNSDANNDSRWDCDEFVEAFHRVMVEVTRRHALSLVGGPPVMQPKQVPENEAPSLPVAPDLTAQNLPHISGLFVSQTTEPTEVSTTVQNQIDGQISSEASVTEGSMSDSTRLDQRSISVEKSVTPEADITV